MHLTCKVHVPCHEHSFFFHPKDLQTYSLIFSTQDQLHVDPTKLNPAFTLLHVPLSLIGYLEEINLIKLHYLKFLYEYIHLLLLVSNFCTLLYLRWFDPYIALESKILFLTFPSLPLGILPLISMVKVTMQSMIYSPTGLRDRSTTCIRGSLYLNLLVLAQGILSKYYDYIESWHFKKSANVLF